MGSLVRWTRRRLLQASGLAALATLGFDVPAATRLLMAAHGSGGFTPQATAIDIASAPAAGWSYFEDPRTVAHGAYTYVGYNVGGTVGIAVITVGAVVATRTLHSSLEYDDHDVPTMAIRTDGKLLTVYSKHLGPDIYRRISTSDLTSDPTLAAGFGSETSLSSGFGATQSTYPSLETFSDNDGSGPAIILWWREHVADVPFMWYAISSDDGASWSGAVHAHSLTYSKTSSDGVDRFDIACTTAPGSGTDEGRVWHLFRQSSTFWLQDGTHLTASQPYAASDLGIVFDGTGSGDEVWITDIVTNGGSPVITFVRYPGGDEDDHRAMYAAWNGSAWDVNEICVMGNPGGISGEYPPGAFNLTYHAGMILDHADPTRVLVGRWITSQVEMFEYTTADGGATFSERQITSASASKNIRPISVRDASGLRFVWLYGTYNTYVDYSLGLRGLTQ